MDEHLGGKARDEEPERRRQPSLLLMPGKMTEVVSKMMLVFKKKSSYVDYKRIWVFFLSIE